MRAGAALKVFSTTLSAQCSLPALTWQRDAASEKRALTLAKLTALVSGGAALDWRSKVTFSDQLF